MPESFKDKFMKYLKDIIYISTLVITLGSVVITTIINRKLMEIQVQKNTDAVNELYKQYEKYNDMFIKQAEINGKIILYIELDKNKDE